MPTTQVQPRFGEVVRTVLQVTSGNFLEMFDFFVYGFYAPFIARALFPHENEYLALMMSLLTFGVGFLMRPLGAIVLGGYTDKHGRRKGLILSLSVMAAGILLIAFAPSYDVAGALAPCMVVTGRLLQGFSAGAEMGGVSVYLFEIAPAQQKGLYVSWQSVSQNVAVVFSAVLGVLLKCYLSSAQMDAWGWRMPFFLGCLIIPVLFMIRRSVKETEFFKSQKHPPSFQQILQSVAANWKIIGRAVMLVTLTPVMFYLLTAYIPTFGPRVLKLSAMDSFIVSLCVGLSNIIWVPVGAALSDKVGRRRVLLVSAFLIMLLAYPGMLYVVHHPSFWHLLFVVLSLAFIYGGFQGTVVVTLTETMPAHIRSTGFSVVWSLAQAIFGGFTPAICTYLIHQTGNSAMPGAWLGLAAGIALLGTLLLVPRTNPALAAKTASAG